jgi:hypothetical protein
MQMKIDTTVAHCVPMAFIFLDLDKTKLLEYVKDGEWEGIPWDVSASELERQGFERLDFEGTVAEFLLGHQTGDYFISHETGRGNFTHAFAAVNGMIFNFFFPSAERKVRAVWQRKLKDDSKIS